MFQLPYTLIAVGISAVSFYAGRQSYIAIVNLQKYEERSERAAKHSETAAHELHKTRTTQGTSAGAVGLTYMINEPTVLLCLGFCAQSELLEDEGQSPIRVRLDLQDPESLNPAIIGVSTVCLVLTTIMISVRVVTKSLTTREILLEDCK
ncbi:MAG: hypothetical protein Q9172_001095 [Xanthocarpia lactea]